MAKNYKAVVSEHLTRQASETRYVVIDVDTREVLCDNEGRGFKTESKALTSYEYKSQGHTTKSQKKLDDKRRKADIEKKYQPHALTQEELEEFFNE